MAARGGANARTPQGWRRDATHAEAKTVQQDPPQLAQRWSEQLGLCVGPELGVQSGLLCDNGASSAAHTAGCKLDPRPLRQADLAARANVRQRPPLRHSSYRPHPPIALRSSQPLAARATTQLPARCAPWLPHVWQRSAGRVIACWLGPSPCRAAPTAAAACRPAAQLPLRLPAAPPAVSRPRSSQKHRQAPQPGQQQHQRQRVITSAGARPCLGAPAGLGGSGSGSGSGVAAAGRHDSGEGAAERVPAAGGPQGAGAQVAAPDQDRDPRRGAPDAGCDGCWAGAGCCWALLGVQGRRTCAGRRPRCMLLISACQLALCALALLGSRRPRTPRAAVPPACLQRCSASRRRRRS